ncbi:VQ motif-containing protein [Corchorus capsularis]|uniref:VQ motif-containing protein n=1 Tax=Corchorus capsularis TaxID=210143 RepID=A0A1R3JLZ8_COCAP|nr:VQ motif-containing protein [Corchorus capsularis]
MGKKVISQVKVKISKKNSEKKKEQQQLNSLIEVLRPKVFITDCSSFKTLVQHLTGNGTSSSSSQVSHELLPSPPSSSTSSPQTQIVPAVIDVDQDHIDHHAAGNVNPESSMETYSFDASVDESFQVCNSNHYLGLNGDYQILNQAYDYDPLPFQDTNSTENDHFLMDINVDQQEVGNSLMAYGDFESLLLDEQILYPSLNVYSQIQQEVSIYDYELSGLI